MPSLLVRPDDEQMTPASCFGRCVRAVALSWVRGGMVVIARIPGDVINHGKHAFWGKPGVHYHQGMKVRTDSTDSMNAHTKTYPCDLTSVYLLALRESLPLVPNQ